MSFEIGSIVKNKRREFGITQQELANKAGVGLNFVYQLEKNKRTVQLNCVEQVLDALDIELSIQPREREALNEQRIKTPAPKPTLPW